MDRTLCQFPDQPGLNRSKKKFSVFRLLPGSRHIVKDPLDLCRGKVCIDHQACLCPEFLREPFLHQGITVFGGPAALPDDRIVHRLSCVLIPDDCRLPLIRDPDRRNVLGGSPDHVHRLHRNAELARPDLIRIVFYPAGFRKMLLEFPLCHTAHFSLLIEQDTSVARCPRVQCHHILSHFSVPPLVSGVPPLSIFSARLPVRLTTASSASGALKSCIAVLHRPHSLIR